jgi:hypothetical protein
MVTHAWHKIGGIIGKTINGHLIGEKINSKCKEILMCSSGKPKLIISHFLVVLKN